MPDAVAMAAVLLVAGPAIGTACLAYPPFVRVWTVPRSTWRSWLPTRSPGGSRTWGLRSRPS
jgi:hypothetical protein